MSNRINRVLIAQDTLKILKQGYFTSPSGQKIDIQAAQQAAEAETIVYSPALSNDLLAKRVTQPLVKSTKMEVNGLTTMDATRLLLAEGYDNVLCLNFASAKNAGGGFLTGSQAQEESIARSTSLYNCLLKAPDYYATNRKIKSGMYTDYMIYSPNVPMIKSERGHNLETLQLASVITAPAVNFGVVKQREPHRISEVEVIMKRRIEKVLMIALEHGHRAIVLGAWGCGVFQNDPPDISFWFKEVIERQFKDEFEKIVFAIYARNERFIRPFLEAFSE